MVGTFFSTNGVQNIFRPVLIGRTQKTKERKEYDTKSPVSQGTDC